MKIQNMGWWVDQQFRGQLAACPHCKKSFALCLNVGRTNEAKQKSSNIKRV